MLTKTLEQAAAKIAQLTGDIAQKSDFTLSQAKNQDEQMENNCKQYTTGLSIWDLGFRLWVMQLLALNIYYLLVAIICGTVLVKWP